MQAVWMVRSQQLYTRFRFWLAIFGYNRHDHSFSQKLYLVYAALFYTLWSFAVLTLLASGTAQALVRLSAFFASSGLGRIEALRQTAVALGVFGLLVWTLWSAYSASRASPLSFSEDDAYLICQTPVNRRAVALAWLPGQWPSSLLPIAGITVTLGFALVEGAAQGELTAADLPRYLLSGLRSVSIIIPLQLGLLALVLALGAYRLQGDRQRPRLFWLPLSLAALLVLYLLSGGRLSPTPSEPLSLTLMPLAYPLQAGFGLATWGFGWLVAAGWATLGLLLLVLASGELNLSRAAQESRGLVARSIAQQLGAREQVEEADQRKALGLQRLPSPLLAIPARRSWQHGAGSLALKDLVQTWRVQRLRRIAAWLVVFFDGMAIFLVTDWGLRGWALLVWSLVVIGQSSRRLQNDLAHWAIFRSLPVSSRQILAADAASAGVTASLVSWASLGAAIVFQGLTGPVVAPGATPLSGAGGLLAVAPLLSSPFTLWAVILLTPFLVANLALAGAWDVTRQSKSSALLAGYAPQPGAFSLTLAALILAGSGALIAWLGAAGLFLALAANLASASLVYHLAGRQFQRIR